MRLAVVLALAGCDWSLHRMQQPVGCTVDGTSPLLANQSCNLQPPPGIVAMTAPMPVPPVTRALVVRGRDRFDRMCAPCHGLRGDGVSAVASSMMLRRPPSLIDPIVTGFSDERITTVMEAGYGLMPSYRWVPAADRYAILHYVRALQHRVVALDQLAPPLRAEARQWLR